MALQHILTKHTYEFAAEPVHSDNLNDIQDAVVELQQYYTDPADLAAALADIAPEYSSSATYTKGTYCIHDGQLYQANQNISTAEAWNSNHWTAVTVAEKLEAIGFHDLIKVTLPGITSLPKTFTVVGITADHESVQDGEALVTPTSSMGSNWTLTTGNGTITVSGTFSGSTSTSIVVTMGIPDNAVTGVAQ